jgi:hypothetical protein
MLLYCLRMHFLKKNKDILLQLLLIGDIAGLYGHLFYNYSSFTGALLLGVFFCITGYYWRETLHKVFGLNKQWLLTKVYAVFSSFLLLTLVGSIYIVWYQFSQKEIIWTYGIAAFLSYAISFVAKQFKKQRDIKVRTTYTPYFSKQPLFLIVYFAIWFVATIALIIFEPSTASVWSPWQALPQWYLYTFFVLTLLLGIIVSSKHKTKVVLTLIVFHSILLHAYLPISHQLPLGGDVWRVMAVEQTLADGKPILPVLFGDNVKKREVLGMNIPEAILIPNKYAYGHLWSASVILHKTLGIGLQNINIWLIPILWALAMPFIFFRLGTLLFKSRRTGLIFTWLTFLVFPLQALGSLTLPVSLGYLTFFFALTLLLQYQRDRAMSQRIFLYILTVFMLFSYTLHFLLILGLLVVVEIYHLFDTHNIAKRMVGVGKRKRYILSGLSLVLATLIIPATEMIAHISSFGSLSFSRLTQMLGQFSGWFFASMIRPHDILSGNILFNHTPDYAFTSSLFMNFRWQMVLGSVIVILFSLFALGRIYYKQKRNDWRLISFLSACAIGGYIFGWFVLEGDRLFTRRLDALLAVVFILLFLYTAYSIRDIIGKYVVPGTMLLALLFASWFGTTSFASGPDIRSMSLSEFTLGAHINEQLSLSEKTCVLADTWTLLAVESASSGRVVGGGFPIDYQFGQQARVELLAAFEHHPEETLATLVNMFGETTCFVAIKKPGEESYANLAEILGDYGVVFEDNVLWRIRLKK